MCCPPCLSQPQVREIVHDFYHSRYGRCFAALEALRPQLAVDIHLHDHTPALLREIRSRALVQYCAPFSAVDLGRMATAFNTSVA